MGNQNTVQKGSSIYIGNTELDFKQKEVTGDVVLIEKEPFYRISNYDTMRPFFMSIVSDSNHWLFLSSNGGISAGRKNSDSALFPYYTDDKITEFSHTTGSRTIVHLKNNGGLHLWEPFSDRYPGMYSIKRNLYKNKVGNKVIFEEINENLGLTFQYQWNTSDLYGFIRKSKLINNNQESLSISVLDGIQNIIPYGVGEQLQNTYSNLVDAYKRNELDKNSGIGIFALSAIIVDRAEPSEALKASIAWSLGLERPKYLVSSLQLEKFIRGYQVIQETDIKAEKGAYFINSDFTLNSKDTKDWLIVADVNQSMGNIAEIANQLKNPENFIKSILEDIELGTKKILELNGAADGIQISQDELRNTRHFANTLFNIMRGGIFDSNYHIEKSDFIPYISNNNKSVYREKKPLLENLPESFTIDFLRNLSSGENPTDIDLNFKRLCYEYLPLKFSRRHGDPSRPWNKFSINTKSEIDGSKILDYQGNWRDIFQNWEALGHSYPEFVESMIHKFLNASTFDGYNPYRVMKNGFDWESIEPNDPWSYIGYWGDHQIIYLLKFLEFIESYYPGKLNSYFNESVFVYANVPYKIKGYNDILKNPKDTIVFDLDEENTIHHLRKEIGLDGALLKDQNSTIYKVNLIEKLLATVLSKLSNFIPDGGIWMNTQRPEWNDANNALVGNGVSMVTLYYMKRFFDFFKKVLQNANLSNVEISIELKEFFQNITSTLQENQEFLKPNGSNVFRKNIMDGLGNAGGNFRNKIYRSSFSGRRASISKEELLSFLSIALEYIEDSIAANKREDGLYHAYNLLTVKATEASISNLSEMLEGQVAVLSSGHLSGKESLGVLDSLKNSALFRHDQYSYILYPNKELLGFVEKNNIPASKIKQSNTLRKLLEEGNTSIIQQDIQGKFHFNGNFKNAEDLNNALNKLSDNSYSELLANDKDFILNLFEEVFDHKSFTGRSGTFFGYEGLGSIYWHMVSKLLLAVQEVCLKAVNDNEIPEIIGRLFEHYYEINEGIGVHKSPKLYGAFPTDPYSHTPSGKGAQQPGMTGQVKEDILSRFGELGIFVEGGKICFNPCLLRKGEFLKMPRDYEYIDLENNHQILKLQQNTLAYTYCQVPIVYNISNINSVEVLKRNGQAITFPGLKLDKETSQLIFKRTGEVIKLNVNLENEILN